MASVTARIRAIEQPRGGYVKPSDFEATVFDDGITLNEDENVHGSIVGMTVEYLTRFTMGTDKAEAFKISLMGATIAEDFGEKKAVGVAEKLIKGINGLDESSVINACKLTTFDVWYRNPIDAWMAKGYKETKPNKETVENIQTLVQRSVTFFEKNGPITKAGFTFEPNKPDDKARKKMMETGKGTYGGYTSTVNDGEGDFLTADTLWDFKVLKSKPVKKHTLQLLVYWIMGQHSGQAIFKDITKIGIFNPRLNTSYLLDISKVSADTIQFVEDEVICY